MQLTRGEVWGLGGGECSELGRPMANAFELQVFLLTAAPGTTGAAKEVATASLTRFES